MAVNKFTRNLMSKFPSWMKMAKDTESLGAQFLDVFGITFEDFQNEIDNAVENFYINTANTEIIDWIYKVPLITEKVKDANGAIILDEVYIETFEGQRLPVKRYANVQGFYHRNANLPCYWLDIRNATLYLRYNLDDVQDMDNPFKSIVINGTQHYNLILHHVWNVFDEFGLLLGLRRLYKENNLFFKQRILDVFINPGNSSRSGIANGIERELNLEHGQVIIENLDNVEEDDSLTLPDGTPTRKLMKYAKKVNETLKYSWNELNLDKAYWFSISQDDIAIHYLPHIWDVDMSSFDKKDFQSGVGYGDDLLVNKPTEESSTRNVKVSIGLIAYYQGYEEIYPEITFKYKIYAKGKIIEKDYLPQNYKYTIEAAEYFNQPYNILAQGDIIDSFKVSIDNNTKIASGTTAPNIYFGKSTDILHNQTHELVKLIVRPTQFSETETPELKYISIIWEDTTGTEREYKFDTENKFFIDSTNAGGQTMVNVLTSGLAFDNEKGLVLGKGLFQDTIDTTEEFKTGRWRSNDIIIENGNVKLNLDAVYSSSLFGPK